MKFLDNSSRNFGIVIGYAIWCLLAGSLLFMPIEIMSAIANRQPVVVCCSIVVIAFFILSGFLAFRSNRLAFLFTALFVISQQGYGLVIGALNWKACGYPAPPSCVDLFFSVRTVMAIMVASLFVIFFFRQSGESVLHDDRHRIMRNFGVILGVSAGFLLLGVPEVWPLGMAYLRGYGREWTMYQWQALIQASMFAVVFVVAIKKWKTSFLCAAFAVLVTALFSWMMLWRYAPQYHSAISWWWGLWCSLPSTIGWIFMTMFFFRAWRQAKAVSA